MPHLSILFRKDSQIAETPSQDRYSSVLKKCYRLFIVFALMIILSVLAVSLIVIHQNALNIRKMAGDSLIRNTSGMMDMALGEVQSTLIQTSKNGSVIDYVINPDSTRYSVKSMAMVSLATTAAESELLQDLYLYVPSNGTVLSSNYELYDVGSFHYATILDSKFADGQVMMFDGRKAFLVVQDGRLLVVMDFPLTESLKLGRLICLIREEALLNQINAGKAGSMYFFSKLGTPLFSDRIVYSDPVLRMAQGKTDMEQCAKTVSAYSGITALLKIDGSTGFAASGFNSTVIWEFAGLVTLVILLCILFGNTLISRLIRPLQDVVDAISRASELYTGNAGHNNEIDLIQNTIETATMRADNMDKVIHSFLPEISYNFYQELLDGRWISTAHLNETLENISSPLLHGDRYAIMVVDYTGLEEITKLIVPVVQEKISHYSHLYSFHYHIHIITDIESAVFLCFDNQNISTLELSQMLYELKKELLSIHLRLHIGFGDICTSLSNICLSYRSALSYLADAPQEKEESGLRQAAMNDGYVAAELERLHLERDKMSETDKRDFLQQMNMQLFFPCQTAQEKQAAWHLLCRDILIQAQKYALKAEAQHLIEGCHATGSFFEMNQEEIAHRGASLCEDIMKLIIAQQNKKQFQHIMSVQDYIEKQYSNPDLGLQAIAESVGLSPQYVSKLFKDIKAVNVNEYVNHVRIDHACQLLSTTQMPVKEISRLTGFNSPQHFSRVFAKLHQVTPLQYRQIHRDSAE